MSPPHLDPPPRSYVKLGFYTPCLGVKENKKETKNSKSNNETTGTGPILETHSLFVSAHSSIMAMSQPSTKSMWLSTCMQNSSSASRYDCDTRTSSTTMITTRKKHYSKGLTSVMRPFVCMHTHACMYQESPKRLSLFLGIMVLVAMIIGHSDMAGSQNSMPCQSVNRRFFITNVARAQKKKNPA